MAPTRAASPARPGTTQSGPSGDTGRRSKQGAVMKGDVVTVERVIPAPAEAIFDLVADAGKHPMIDGSGTVKEAKPGAPQRLVLESEFGMSMKVGVAYSLVNTVIE